MIREIIQYPTPLSLEFGANVRHFDDSLKQLIQDLKDTMIHHNLDALSAFQIGSSLSVMVITYDDTLLEMINPVIIKREGEITPIETTAYFPYLSAKTKRYQKITLMYEDIKGQQHFLTAEDNVAITIQRKSDYLLGADFRIRMDGEERTRFDSKLDFGTDDLDSSHCPTVFKRDKILRIIHYGLILGIIALGIGLFLSGSHLVLLKSGLQILMLTLFILIVGYFFYAQYEGKQYKQCTSCQIGNILGTAVIASVKLLLLYLGYVVLL